MGLGALQPGHLIVILVIVLLIFGPGKLPELGKAVGEGLRELKKATGNDDRKDALPAPATPATAATTTTPATAAPVTTAATTVATAPTPIASASTHAARVCPSCRGSVPAGDKFCGNCGASLEPATRSA